MKIEILSGSGCYRCFLLLVKFCMITSLLFSTWANAEQEGKKPNVVLIVADYMGYADIQPFGATDVKTPALSELAEKGLRFSNYYAAAPTCIPSRASLLSGKYPSKVLTRFPKLERGKGLPAQHNTLLRELKAINYKTALIGKWHLGSTKNFRPMDHGFDFFFGFDSWTLGYHDHLNSNGEPGLLRNGKLVNETGYLTDMFSDEAVKFIDKSADAPFFLYLAYNAGLPPYQGPNLDKSKWGEGWDANKASRTDYISMIESMDRGIFRILEKLDELQVAENTLVIFTYDHGGRHLVDSGPFFHGFSTLWEGGIHVPMILRWPNNVEGGKLIKTPAIAMDLTASILDAVGQHSAISTIDGISLFPVIAKPEKTEQRTFFWRRSKMKAVRRGKWKYIIDGHTQLLFNLEEDVSERVNVFNKYPVLATQLRNALLDWEQSIE